MRGEFSHFDWTAGRLGCGRRALPPDMHAVFDDVVLRGRLAPMGMGRFDDVLSAADVAAIHAFLSNEATMAARKRGP